MRKKRWLSQMASGGLIMTVLASTFTGTVFAGRALTNETVALFAGQAAASETAALASGSSTVEYNGERRISFNDHWRFQRETSGSIPGVQNPGFNDSSWRQLTLPHDWSIELDFNYSSPATHEGGYLDGGIGWYRKTFTLPSSMKGKQVSIDFDGVYMNSTTYLNGQLLGTYPYGYNAFSYNISDLLYTDGRENVIVVKVNNTQPSSRWYSGSGIYRNVYLTVTEPIHIARYGTFVTTPNLENAFAEGRADVHIATKVSNDSAQSAQVQVKSTIYDADGTAVQAVLSESRTVPGGQTVLVEDQTSVEHPTLWGIDNPYRYKLVTEIISGGRTVDTYETPFGIRYFEFDNNEGFSLNGQYMKLHGVSMHHDLGALGAAVNARAVERQMQMMKDMGVNAIRVTHNPASPELLEAANKLGLLVVEEAFDAWNYSKKTYDYARFFSAWSDQYSSTWAEHDIKEMVDRGKNEPSIIMWSLGNEIYDTQTTGGRATAIQLNGWVKEIDTTRPTTIGQDSMRPETINSNIKAVLDVVDIAGFNYAENNYDNFHQQFPDWIIYGSETSSATRSRGVYTHPYQNNAMGTYPDYQQSSYDNDWVGWGKSAEDAWKADRDRKHIAGQFIWTGFDYIGEPTPYYSSLPKSSYFGAVDTAGFPKDIFYYYQSQWKEEPMVHLLPHWNWTTGETVRVLAYSNASKVELSLNGVSLGERSYVNKTTSFGVPYKETSAGKTYLEWAVPFEAGTLEAIAKDESGRIIARDKVVTAGPPAAVKLTADRHVITADGKDLSFITVDIVDREGNIVPTADHLVKFSVSGDGELVGVDNGNALSIERFKDDKRKAFNGKALAIVQSNQNSGVIKLSAVSSGLAGDAIQMYTIPASEVNLHEAAGFERIEVTTRVKEAPELPASLEVYYKDSTVQTKAVAWEAIDPARYAQVGSFTVEGRVDGIESKAVAYVTVNSVAAIKSIAAVTMPGHIPELPSHVSLLYSNDTTKDVPVLWDAITDQQVANKGSFIVEGSVADTSMRAQAFIRVTDETQRVNLMLAKPGSAYPKLAASYTANGDNLAHINDGIKSYSDSPKNRWTSWLSPNPGDSITVDFAAADSIDNLNLFVFTDHGTAVPGSVKVEYWNGTAWVEVRNKVEPTPYITGENHISFAPIITDQLRFYMTPSVSGKYSALTEVEVYANQLMKGTTANLAEITLDGLPLKDFTAAKHNYELILPANAEIPVVEAIGADHATITILPAIAIPGEAKIYVTSEDGLVASEYVISLLPEPPLKEVESIDPVTMVIDKGALPVLPEQILARYNDGSYAVVKVDWEAIDPDLYNQLGEFIVEGSIEGTDIKAKAVIIVKTALAVEHTATAILRNQTPTLPQLVTVYFGDGTEEQKAVNWAAIPAGQFDKTGIYELSGSVEGVVMQATASIRVTDEAGEVKNISLAKNGYDYPKAEASFTNNGPASKDTIESINDGIISYNDSPQNRWTNWQRTPRTGGDWVSVTFGDFGPVEHDVDNMEIHWFADSGTSYPASFKIQYKSGDDWVDVTNVSANPSTPKANQANYYTFDMVRTSAIRVDMMPQSGLSLAITEISIYSKSAVAGSEPVVSDIQVDGSSIKDKFVPVNGGYETTIKLASVKDLPQITATGENNTSITIVPVLTAPAAAKVIAKSEDGKKTATYLIRFIVEDEGETERLAVVLSGPETVQSEEQFTVDLGLKNVAAALQAHDITVQYDSDTFEFVHARLKKDQMQIIKTITDIPGEIRFIIASLGEQNALRADEIFLELTWQAKATEQAVKGTIRTAQATISDSAGYETDAVQASLAVQVSPVAVPGSPDVNGDGKVSIGDLSIAAAHYGKTKDSPDWQLAKRADVNGDGVIDIEDLAAIARALLK